MSESLSGHYLYQLLYELVRKFFELGVLVGQDVRLVPTVIAYSSIVL